jgi:hypothetical protein
MNIIVICGQVPTLMYRKNKFVTSFCLIELGFFPFVCEKGLTYSDPSIS